ncbi:hypothetical protein GCM10007079_28960 [Nocardiopsis terrae]|nr:hypothetical protein GCM10007079_28960 [Nocardiopsis terrae]
MPRFACCATAAARLSAVMRGGGGRAAPEPPSRRDLATRGNFGAEIAPGSKITVKKATRTARTAALTRSETGPLEPLVGGIPEPSGAGALQANDKPQVPTEPKQRHSVG